MELTAAAIPEESVVFLLDVDNTLLDNDRVIADLMRYLDVEVGSECQERYWRIFNAVRTELGYADYLGALERYRLEHPHDHRLTAVSSYLINYPYANRLYPESLDVIERLRSLGTVVILSDGDVVLQPHKIARSGLYEAVEGRVLIYVHKERELADIAERYPALQYVVVDDKLRLLSAFKRTWGGRVVTILPQQGHYARNMSVRKAFPPADVTIDRIGDLLSVDVGTLFGLVARPKRA